MQVDLKSCRPCHKTLQFSGFAESQEGLPESEGPPCPQASIKDGQRCPKGTRNINFPISSSWVWGQPLV